MADAPAYELAPNVWRIPVASSDGINAFMLRGDDDQITLIDAGLPFAWKRLEGGLKHAGVDVADVTRILVTHAHSDHAGNVEKVRKISGAPVSAHEDDARYLRAGESPPIDPRMKFRPLLQRWGRYDAVEVSDTFTDRELIDVAGGVRAIHTPGHTPGHTTYLHEPTGVLITGDVIHFWRAQIRIGIKFFCHDITLNEISAQKLADQSPDVVAFTHGPHIDADATSRLHSFLASRVTA